MIHVMLDLETMGTAMTSAIVSIGAVEFDPNSTRFGTSFHEHILLKSAVKAGFTLDPDTVIWWLNQSDDARSRLTRGQVGADTVVDALQRFSGWLGTLAPKKERVIWGNGAAFDNALLASAYARTGLELPWEFYNDACYRTIKNLHPEIKIVREGVHHDARDDAISQAKHLQAINASLKGA